jgi:hypothetical protein
LKDITSAIAALEEEGMERHDFPLSSLLTMLDRLNAEIARSKQVPKQAQESANRREGPTAQFDDDVANKQRQQQDRSDNKPRGR